VDLNFFGIGVPELIVIFLLMLVVLGPKRMLTMAYQAGIYLQKARRVIDQTMIAVRKELEASNIDLPKDLKDLRSPLSKANVPRFDIVKEASRFLNEGSTSTPPDTTTTPPANTASTTVPEPSPKPGDEKPRYDSWLPKN